ncbi:MAG: 4-hydroxy-tetrahydrodipicolinate reductase [Verrucomicrobia bacterium]|nr:4-hydroxy-tetrahydrodipicolinate reductase [Verrucomicrobiota bacterium]MCG2679207.1 4-hydroxy-tetrahydrodipicolinate reductase [Kiritimatiellia bacterium]MBU4248600.1 4-hydroxy-tetrahydrodipicolinate reductase [Verrucomicrobiota bacterium]MBU4290062.1 4-hydroxy-tetrahydrodipicolinate reductase [Verrucomicrobiota bacterium]MBU4428924.1 4-hydroxy-tetrahydrodipicolinate reductase [Verrucomicrobiota bacterium]
MIKITILGAAGRMGQALIRCSRQTATLRVVGAVDADQCPLLGKDAGVVAGIADIGVLLSADPRKAAHAADVLIDFSFPSATVLHARLAAELKKAMVIGTTGLNEKDSEGVRKASKKIPIVWSPNMSLGVNLLFAMVEQTARRLAAYDVEIVEIHHQHKKDAPSGTALRLAEATASARGLTLNAAVIHGRQGMVGERPAGQIGIHSLRAGDVVGDHTVIFATNGERLELTHRAGSRDCFALGALRAAEWVMGRKPGLYSMQHVLEINS